MRGVTNPPCAVDGCPVRAYRNFRWCQKHHQRWLTHGDPEVGIVWLDAGPLLEAFDARRGKWGPSLAELLSKSDQKLLQKAKQRGRVTECTADRLAVRGLGLTVDEVYGLEACQEAV